MNSIDSKNKKRFQTLKWIFFILLALVFAADFLVPRHPADFVWDHISGFSAVFGFISVVVIIIISKVIGKLIVTRKEDYYD